MKPVILISMDTVRQDVFNSQCFPQSWPTITLEFTRFPNALSSGVATPHSFPGIITGTPVIGDGEFSDGATTIMESVQGESIVFTNNGHLRAERGYDRGATAFADNQLPTNQQVSPPTVVDRLKQVDIINNSTVLEKIYSKYQSVRTGDEYFTPKYGAGTVTDWALSELERDPPEFLWAHYMDAHKPFNPAKAVEPPDLDISKERLDYLNDYDREDDPPNEKDQELLKELYESNVRFLDDGLARLLEEVQTYDWYDEALIVLVSDHGELFGEHGHMWHPMTIDPVDELIDVPLAVKFPQGDHAGDVVSDRVQHADIPVTIESHLVQTESYPENTYHLLKSNERLSMSKSNTSIRVTGNDGHIVRRRNGSEEEHGTVSDDMRETVRNAEFPNVRTNAGVVRGIEDVDRMEQLEALGYK